MEPEGFRSDEECVSMTMHETERLQALASGSTSTFWMALSECLLELRQEAIEELVRTDPTKIGEICELQQIIRVVHRIVSLVEGAHGELMSMDRKTKGGANL